jgi:hypothetical protein
VPDPENKPDTAPGPSGAPDAAPAAAAAAEKGAEPSAAVAAESGPVGEQANKFAPDAIAARIQSIGEEDEIDRIAATEEKKLLERRDEQRKKKGKSGLEAAASKRLAKIGEGTVKRPSQALAGDISPDMDPLVSRAFDAQKWIKDNAQLFTILVVVAVLGLGGFLGWSFWQDKRNADASALLAKAFADEHGHVSDKEPDDGDTLTTELYPTFKSAAERRDTAIAQCRAVETRYAGTGAAILARLSEASLLLDAGDAKGALAAYDDVRGSPLAKADPEVRGRAVEGIGFADELLAKGEGPGNEKYLDEALAAYRDLAAIDSTGIKELGLYHQARVLLAKGNKAKAIDLLKEDHKLVSDPGETHAFPYLAFVVEDRLRELDPTALPPKPMKFPGMGAGGEPGAPGGSPNMDDPRIQEILRQLKAKGRGAPPPMPAPGPASSAP